MRREKCLLLILALLLALLPGCGMIGEGAPASETSQAQLPEPDPEYPVAVGGAIIDFRPTRVVSLAPSLTEKIYDLGHGRRLVGISDHQGDYPASIAHLPAFGIATMPDIDGILALVPQPHVVFSVSELPADAMTALENAQIPLVILPSYAQSMVQLEEIYMGISVALDGRTSGRIVGELFMRELNERIDAIAARFAGYARKNAVYLRALDFMMATGDTLEGELMQRIGFVNIAAGQSGWVFDPEEASAPPGQELFQSIEVIFFDPGYVSREALGQSAFWRGLSSVTGDRYVNVDNQIFERQTLRMLGQLEIMAQARAPQTPAEDDDS